MHGVRTPNESFFLNIPNILANWCIGRVSGLTNSMYRTICSNFCHCVSLVRDFATTTQSCFSEKKLRFSYIVQDWGMDLGCK